VFPAFFLVFKGIFSDVFSIYEHLLNFLLVFITYGGLALLISLVWPGRVLRWTICLSLFAIIFVVWYSTYEAWQIPLHIIYMVLTVSSAYAGAALGARFSSKRRHG